jgi:hypothetical protein
MNDVKRLIEEESDSKFNVNVTLDMHSREVSLNNSSKY